MQKVDPMVAVKVRGKVDYLAAHWDESAAASWVVPLVGSTVAKVEPMVGLKAVPWEVWMVAWKVG